MTAVRVYCRLKRQIKQKGSEYLERKRRHMGNTLTFVGTIQSVPILPKVNMKFTEFLRSAAGVLEKKNKIMSYIGKVINLQRIVRRWIKNKRNRKQAITDCLNAHIEAAKETENNILKKKKGTEVKRIQWPLLTS